MYCSTDSHSPGLTVLSLTGTPSLSFICGSNRWESLPRSPLPIVFDSSLGQSSLRERERFTLTQPSLLPATAPLRDSTETEDKGDEHGWGRRPDSLIGGKIMELKEPGMATLSDILFLSNWIL